MIMQQIFLNGFGTLHLKENYNRKYIFKYGMTYGFGRFEFRRIEKVYKCPEEIVMPYNRHYIILAFDYVPKRSGMEVVKISERLTTAHFREHISKN